MVFKANYDTHIITVPILMIFFWVVNKLTQETINYWEVIWIIILSGGIYAFVLGNMLSIKYICTETELIIKSCFFSNIIRLEEIKKIQRKIGCYSFLAPSSVQLQIVFKDNKKMNIAPRNIDELERHLMALCKEREE